MRMTLKFVYYSKPFMLNWESNAQVIIVLHYCYCNSNYQKNIDILGMTVLCRNNPVASIISYQTLYWQRFCCIKYFIASAFICHTSSLMFLTKLQSMYSSVHFYTLNQTFSLKFTFEVKFFRFWRPQYP